MANKIFRIYGITIAVILLTYSTVLAQFTLLPSGTVTTSSTTFTMSGSITGVSYQLRSSSSNIPGVGPVIGTGSAISFINVPTSASGVYTVVNSDNVQVAGTYIVVCPMPKPSDWYIKANSVVICDGSSVTLSILPISAPSSSNYFPNSYKWYNNGTLITGQTTSTLTVNTPGQYNAVVGFNCGNITLTSLNVTAAATGPGAIIPANLSIPIGTSSMQLVGTIPSPCGTAVYTYQWQNSPDQNIWTNILGATSSNYSPKASIIIGSRTYYRRITYNNGSAIGNSNVSSVFTISNCVPLAANIDANQNYILSSTPRISSFTTASNFTNRSTCELMQTAQYIDGLGRPIQIVQIKASPALNDIVQPIVYDAFGRETVKYLPYTSTSGPSDGSYKGNVLAAQSAFYASPQADISKIPNPYSITVFEPSSLNRINEQGTPGAPWQPFDFGISTSGHTSKIVYSANNTIALTDTANSALVAMYTISAINGITQQRTLAKTGNYGTGELYLTISKDENWKSGRGGTTEEYKDKEGHVVLKRTFNWVAGTSKLEVLSTYYVYDYLGNLAFVLPALSNADNVLPTQAILDNLCYQYRYDERNRLTQKKLPGKGWEYMVYNKRDQIVATQDASQRAKITPEWTITRYDALGRTIVSGTYQYGSTNADTRATVQTQVNGFTALSETPTGAAANYGYTTVSFPASVSSTLSVNYYDNYTFAGSNPYPYAGSSMTKGLSTGSLTNVLGTANMLWNVNYYDDKGRRIKAYKQHYLGGIISPYNYDEITSTYDFTNQVTATTRNHYTKNSTGTSAVLTATINSRYEYDNIGRKINSFEKIDAGPEVLLAGNEYNEIGQLKAKHLHSIDKGITFKQDITYAYNERGWLNMINDPALAPTTTRLFSERLNYNTPQYAATPQFNGNIAEQSYQIYNSTIGVQTVKYAYDQLNRLTDGTSSMGYSETGISYDLAGNIKTLNRATAPNAAALNYTYTGNQLTAVTKGGSAFRSYSYDANGNATSDGQGNIIAYNLLNLPQNIANKNLSYIYDATGSKLRKISGGITTEYISGIQYTGVNIDFIQTEEGRAIKNGTNYNYEYTLTDHLGNNRVTFDQTNGKVGENDYYPFGLSVQVGPVVSPQNKYLYNGKELQEELGQLDYGARFYDPVIGKWTSVDPLAEINRRFSPYTYVENNPIRLIDPDGMSATEADGNQVITDPDDIWAFLARLKKRADDARKERENSPVIKAWKKRTDAANKAYGTTFAKRASNWRFWYDAIMVEGAFESHPDLTKATMGDNPITWLVSGPVGMAKEAQVIAEAESILKESNLLIDAFKAGKGIELKIAGRTIIVEPEAPVSGMTLFGEKAFVLGKEAFVSGEELSKTILHELYRLTNSAGGATSGAKAAQETKAAANFAERAVKKLK